MRPSIIGLLRKAMGSRDVVTLVDDGVYAIKRGDGIVIAWDRDDAISIVAGGSPDGMEECDVLVGMHGDVDSKLPRIASSDGLRVHLGGRPMLFRFSQFGGQGGMLPSTGFGIGMGPGAGSALAGTDQFGSNIVRQQFDISLEQARKSREDNDWDRSIETRLQSNKIYGHQRNEKDRNLEPYTLTFNERRRMRRRRYLQKRRENIERAKEKEEGNTVRSIKNISPDPRHLVTTEFRLKDRRQTPDPIPGEKRKYHGPESEFVHFPPPDGTVKPGPTVRIATQFGVNTIFDDHGEETALAEMLRPRPTPGGDVSGKSSSPGGTERGLSSLHPGGGWPSTSPNISDRRTVDPYVGGRDAIHSMPASMTEQTGDLHGGVDKYDADNFRKLYLNETNETVLPDYAPFHREPSQGIPFLSPSETEQMANAFRDRVAPYTKKRSPDGTGDEPTERKLSRLHRRRWPATGRQYTIDEYANPEPYTSYSPGARLTINAPSGQGVI